MEKSQNDQQRSKVIEMPPMDTKFSIENNILKGESRPLHNIADKHNVGSVLLNLITEHGPKIAQINAETGEQRTFQEIRDRSVRCALWLKEEKIGPGDVVSICTHNQLDACIPPLATFYNGAVYNSWHHEVTLDSAQYFMQLVKPKIIFACESSVDVLLEAVRSQNSQIKIIVFGKHPQVESLTDIMNRQSDVDVRKYKPREIENPMHDTAIILFSSGTSGLPKAVTHCYGKAIDNFFHFMLLTPKIGLWYSALCWISGTYLTFRFLLTGTTWILHSGFDVDETFKVLNQFKVEWMFITSQMLAHTSKKNALEKHSVKYLKSFVAGGTKMNPEDFVYFKKHCPNTKLFQLYGLTESGSTTTWQTENNSIDSIGQVMFNQHLKIVDTSSGEALGPNKQGEIVIKPSGLMMGYLNNPEATKETIDEEGWLHTGDLGHYNNKGEIFITDRLKEVMKYCGHHVAPAEIENLLLTHPAVLEVAVVPVPHDVDVERPMAFVKKVLGAEVTEQELVELSSKLGKYKTLHGGVKFLENIPRTASGKVRRQELKNMAKNYKH